MIILIGGSSHVGKTLLAGKLMERLHMPYFSLDYLKAAFVRTGKTQLTMADDYALRYEMWPFAAEIVKAAVDSGRSLILEGCYIPGEWKDAFSEPYLRKIRSVFLVMSEEYIRGHADDIRSFSEEAEKRPGDVIDTERLVRCSLEFYEDCEKYGIPCYEISGSYDIEAITEDVLRILEIS